MRTNAFAKALACTAMATILVSIGGGSVTKIRGADAILRCLEKDPENRYAATRDLVHDLTHAREHFPDGNVMLWRDSLDLSTSVKGDIRSRVLARITSRPGSPLRPTASGLPGLIATRQKAVAAPQSASAGLIRS